MKHAFLRTLCAMMTVLLLAAPVHAEEAAPGITASPTASPAPGGTTLLERLRNPVQLPETCLITYALEHGDGTVELVSMGRDSEGRYYLAENGEETLYVPENSYYRQAGVAHQAYTLAHIEQEAGTFMECARGSLLQYAPGAVWVREETMCGRVADVYEVTHDIVLFAHTSTLAVDRETGLCLYLVGDASLMGFALTSDTNVVCTQFVTEDVVLPGTEDIPAPGETI